MSQEQTQPTNAGSRRRITEVSVGVATLIVSLILFSWNFYEDEKDERIARESKETDRIFEQVFADSLISVVNHADWYIENDLGLYLDEKERFEDFWDSTRNRLNTPMMIVTSRLQSLYDCVEEGECDKHAVYSRFPEAAYQAIAFLGEFVFISGALERRNPNGWWLGNELYWFLTEYCEWISDHDYRIPLWSPYLETRRDHYRVHAKPDGCFLPFTGPRRVHE